MNLVIECAKVVFLSAALISVVPLMVWVERRGSALMQNRLGPNRIGPWGLLQSAADVVKFFWKEDAIPHHVHRLFYVLAPLFSFLPAFITFAVIPFASSVMINEQEVFFQVAHLNVGLLYTLSITSLAVYGILTAGWSSRNPYALLGSLRSTSQMVSYELTLGLTLASIVCCYGQVDLREIVLAQMDHFQWIPLPKLGIFLQPFGFLLFLISIFAETNRLPFDLPEGESELIAGYHLEYGSMKFAMFFMSEYLAMAAASGLCVTLFLGGYQMLPGLSFLWEALGSNPWLKIGFEMGSFAAKVFFFLWLFVWVRWTIPRFRYDQLMNLGWRVLVPLALINLVGTALVLQTGCRWGWIVCS